MIFLHPVLYFRCKMATMTISDYADMLESRKLARMFACSQNGTAHYLVIIPYENKDREEARFETWKEGVLNELREHCFDVQGINQKDAHAINAALRENPKSFGWALLKFEREELQSLIIPEEVLADMPTGSAGGLQ